MKKIKTSMSLEPARLARLKRIAGKERRSVSQLMDMAVEQLLPAFDESLLDLEDLAPAIAFPKPKGQGTTPSLNAKTSSSPHSALRIPRSAFRVPHFP